MVPPVLLSSPKITGKSFLLTKTCSSICALDQSDPFLPSERLFFFHIFPLTVVLSSFLYWIFIICIWPKAIILKISAPPAFFSISPFYFSSKFHSHASQKCCLLICFYFPNLIHFSIHFLLASVTIILWKSISHGYRLIPCCQIQRTHFCPYLSWLFNSLDTVHHSVLFEAHTFFLLALFFPLKISFPFLCQFIFLYLISKC